MESSNKQIKVKKGQGNMGAAAQVRSIQNWDRIEDVHDLLNELLRTEKEVFEERFDESIAEMDIELERITDSRFVDLEVTEAQAFQVVTKIQRAAVQLDQAARKTMVVSFPSKKKA